MKKQTEDYEKAVIEFQVYSHLYWRETRDFVGWAPSWE